jgi:hypothetical protein
MLLISWNFRGNIRDNGKESRSTKEVQNQKRALDDTREDNRTSWNVMFRRYMREIFGEKHRIISSESENNSRALESEKKYHANIPR